MSDIDRSIDGSIDRYNWGIFQQALFDYKGDPKATSYTFFDRSPGDWV